MPLLIYSSISKDLLSKSIHLWLFIHSFIHSSIYKDFFSQPMHLWLFGYLSICIHVNQYLYILFKCIDFHWFLLISSSLLCCSPPSQIKVLDGEDEYYKLLASVDSIPEEELYRPGTPHTLF